MRRFTRSIKRGLANRRSAQGRGGNRPNLWVEFVDLVTSESEQEESMKQEENSEKAAFQPEPEEDQKEPEPNKDPSDDERVESDPSEDGSCGSPEKTPSTPSYVVTPGTGESNNAKENSEGEATRTYVPVKYPIFPPMRTKPEEKCYWSLTGPGCRPVLTAPEPKPETDEEKGTILLKGEDTELPGSPGYLPTTIPTSYWWEEVKQDNNPDRTFRDMLAYAEASAPFRVPINSTKKKRKDHRTVGEMINWYQKPYGFINRP